MRLLPPDNSGRSLHQVDGRAPHLPCHAVRSWSYDAAAGHCRLYGVIAYAISHRTREIGIRTALVQQRSALTRMFVLQGLTLTAIGVVCGTVR
jgi:hypothetical protein